MHVVVETRDARGNPDDIACGVLGIVLLLSPDLKLVPVMCIFWRK